MPRQKYAEELRLQVAREYQKNATGYKKLAQKYQLSRDIVRSWVKSRRLQRMLAAEAAESNESAADSSEPTAEETV